MDSNIQQEIILLLNIDNVDANEQIKILSICSNVLSSKDFLSNLVSTLENLFNQQDFDLTSEFARVVLAIIKISNNATYYKDIDIKRMKYVIYAVFYYYMLKYKTDLLNKLDLGSLRLLYSNAYDLVELVPETVKIAKQGCLSCFCLSNKIKI